MADNEFVLVETTFPFGVLGTKASAFAVEVVKKRLAACANVHHPIYSAYMWNGKLKRSREVLLSFKTTRARLESLVSAIRASHPYEVPYIGVLPLDLRHEAYARWVRTESGG